MAFNPFSFIWRKLRQFGPLVGIIVGRVLQHGVDDALLKLALAYVKEAAKKEISKAERREWVVQLLMKKGLSESLARWAVESAYQLYKAEIEKVGVGKATSDSIFWGT